MQLEAESTKRELRLTERERRLEESLTALASERKAFQTECGAFRHTVQIAEGLTVYYNDVCHTPIPKFTT